MNFTKPCGTHIYTTTGSITPSGGPLQNKSKGYSFVLSRSCAITSMDTIASSLIESYFFSINNNIASLLWSNATYSHNANKVTIHMFYYSKNNPNTEKSTQESLSKTQVSSLSSSLASLYRKEVSLVLTRIHYPYLNSSIFSKYLAYNAPSNTFVHFQDSILSYPSRNASELPSYITGIKIQLAGRLLTEPVVPRITKKVALFGSFSGMVDYAKYTTKNELGTFTIKV